MTREAFGVSGLTLASYDYRFLLATAPRYLPWLDELLVGVDADGLTWSGSRFTIPPSFFQDLSEIDESPPKIRLVSRSFYSASRSPMENDVAERNAVSLEARPGTWLVSIDADEYLLNPREFFAFLQSRAPEDPVSIEARWITVFKDFGESLLLVAAAPDGSLERFPIATSRRGRFVAARRTDGPTVLSPGLALHYSWGRDGGELLQKLTNWSHSRDFDVKKYFDFWSSVDESNYSTVRDFHPLWPKLWSRLVRVPASDLDNWRHWDLGQRGSLGARPTLWERAARWLRG